MNAAVSFVIIVSGQGRGCRAQGGLIGRGLLEEVNEEWAWEVDGTFSELLKPLPWGRDGQECPRTSTPAMAVGSRKSGCWGLTPSLTWVLGRLGCLSASDSQYPISAFLSPDMVPRHPYPEASFREAAHAPFGPAGTSPGAEQG